MAKLPCALSPVDLEKNKNIAAVEIVIGRMDRTWHTNTVYVDTTKMGGRSRVVRAAAIAFLQKTLDAQNYECAFLTVCAHSWVVDEEEAQAGEFSFPTA